MKNTLTQTQNLAEIRAVLVCVYEKGDDKAKQAADASLRELDGLLKTAGGSTVATLTQAMESPNKRTYLGSGKLAELAELCKNNPDVSLVVFDCELTPSQIRNIEKELGDALRVIDRSVLILDIFALHAATAEGKLQVELAQLKYTAPRLSGHGVEMSRLGGGIGTRGPGESQLETDRRHLERRIAALEHEIESAARTRETLRRSREKGGLFNIAICGYTNAGKSTLLNLLTGAGVLAEDKLFATLDTTVRKYTLPSGREILLTDTVGFIRNLPHHLISAFKSTLEEITYADAVIVVVDASDPERDAQLAVTRGLLADLKAADKPTMYIFNKCDLPGGDELSPPPSGAVSVSLISQKGVGELVDGIEKLASEGKFTLTFTLPIEDGGSLNLLYKSAEVHEITYTESAAIVRATVDEKIKGQMKQFTVH